MLSSFIVVFREILEVSIVLGVVIAATRGLPGRTLWIWAGIGGGVIGSLLVALFADVISDAAAGMGQELFNAGVLILASVMIGWTVLWMRQHAREMVAHIKKVGADVMAGQLPAYSIAVVIALAVLREGSEIVLFTYSMVASGQSLMEVALGGIGGGLAGSALGYLLYVGIIRIPTRYVFQVTSWLLIFLAAGMASLAAKYLVASGQLEILTKTVWDTSWLLPEGSILGKILQAMIGYSDQPMEIQLLFFGVTLAILAGLMRMLDKQHMAAAALRKTA